MRQTKYANAKKLQVLHSAIFQIVANNFLEVLLRSYWHVGVFVILTKSNRSELKFSTGLCATLSVSKKDLLDFFVSVCLNDISAIPNSKLLIN